MNYERKYKEALERAKRLHSEPTGGTERIVCEQIFPELIESADERIRKAIIEHLRQDIELELILSEEEGNEWIAWLEKQGETYTKKDVDDAWVEGVCYARRELEKQDLQNLANSTKTCKD